jgi:hypothetical protein
MHSRTFLILTLAAAAHAPFAFAGDGPDSDAPDSSSKAVSHSAPTAAEFAPMTSTERFRNFLIGAFGPEAILRSAASAGIRQAEGVPREWGGGAQGYGDRLGSGMAQHVIQSTLQYGASVALHEDNRYFVSGQTGFFRRTRYAIASTFLARHDNGSRSFSFSRMGGAAGAAFISRIWQPPSTTSGGDGAVSFGITIGSEVGFNVFHEFWPDLKRHFKKG